MRPRRRQLSGTSVLMIALVFISSGLVSRSGVAIPAQVGVSSPAAVDISEVQALRWTPSEGQFFVQADEGKTWHVFDHKLRLLASYPEGFAPILPPSPLECHMEGEGVALKISGPSGRKLSWNPTSHELHLSGAKWESGGKGQWGPGWLTVEFRCAQNLGPWLEWQDPAGQRHLVSVGVDPNNPVIQRAYIRSIAPGWEIRLRHKPVGYFYPIRKWTDWIDLQVPEVDPAGPRPTSSLRTEPSVLPRVEPPR